MQFIKITFRLQFGLCSLCCTVHPWVSSVQFSSLAQSCPTLCDPMNRSTPGLPVHHQLLEFTQTHVHRVADAIQPSHPRLSPSPPAPNPSQHQSVFQWVNSSVFSVLQFCFDVCRCLNPWVCNLYQFWGENGINLSWNNCFCFFPFQMWSSVLESLNLILPIFCIF